MDSVSFILDARMLKAAAVFSAGDPVRPALNGVWVALSPYEAKVKGMDDDAMCVEHVFATDSYQLSVLWDGQRAISDGIASIENNNAFPQDIAEARPHVQVFVPADIIAGIKVSKGRFKPAHVHVSRGACSLTTYDDNVTFVPDEYMHRIMTAQVSGALEGPTVKFEVMLSKPPAYKQLLNSNEPAGMAVAFGWNPDYLARYATVAKIYAYKEGKGSRVPHVKFHGNQDRGERKPMYFSMRTADVTMVSILMPVHDDTQTW